LGWQGVDGEEDKMLRDTRFAAIAGAVGAVVLTAAAVTDWVVGGVSDVGAPAAAMLVAHIGGYVLLLPAALALRERNADAFGRPGRVATVTMIGSLVAMTIGFIGLALLGEVAVVGVLTGAGFLGLFLSALAIGIALWRRGVARPAAALLLAPIPLLALLVAIEALSIVPSHPAAMEGAVYFGLALFAVDRWAPRSTTDAASVSTTG
jgi:hypothetical protein